MVDSRFDDFNNSDEEEQTPSFRRFQVDRPRALPEFSIKFDKGLSPVVWLGTEFVGIPHGEAALRDLALHARQPRVALPPYLALKTESPRPRSWYEQNCDRLWPEELIKDYMFALDPGRSQVIANALAEVRHGAEPAKVYFTKILPILRDADRYASEVMANRQQGLMKRLINTIARGFVCEVVAKFKSEISVYFGPPCMVMRNGEIL